MILVGSSGKSDYICFAVEVAVVSLVFDVFPWLIHSANSSPFMASHNLSVKILIGAR